MTNVHFCFQKLTSFKYFYVRHLNPHFDETDFVFGYCFTAILSALRLYIIKDWFIYVYYQGIFDFDFLQNMVFFRWSFLWQT